jgi:iron complex transport system substrate-binding protein
LKQQHRLVGVTRFSDYPAEARNFPKVGSYVQLDTERIAALQPDLCIAIKDGNPKPVISRLESMGIPVYAVDPRNLQSVMQALLAVGGLMQAETAARELQQTSDTIARVQYRFRRLHRPEFFFRSAFHRLFPSDGHLCPELIEKQEDQSAAGPSPIPFSREQLGLHRR